MNRRKRTKKEFTPYNDYQDRPFGLKWGTAFAVDELTKSINDGKYDSLKNNEKLNQMSREEIDEVLQIAFTKSKRVSIQLNVYDLYNRIEDNIEGTFTGFADTDNLYIDDEAISWELIRNVKLI